LDNTGLHDNVKNYFFFNFENVPYKIVLSRCQIRVQESARMQDFAFTPGRTATALCAVDQPTLRVEGPLHVVEGY
jgi:hypothetical protein